MPWHALGVCNVPTNTRKSTNPTPNPTKANMTASTVTAIERKSQFNHKSEMLSPENDVAK